MDENKTALNESLIIWVSFFFLHGNHGSVFAYLFVGGGGWGYQRKQFTSSEKMRQI